MSADLPGLGSRREAREEALALLYASDAGVDVLTDLAATSEVDPGEYAIEIAEGVDAARTEIDRLISEHLTGWTLGRMAAVDRAIARIATWELTTRPDVPTGVVLSEAVEIATMYCGEQSPRFLNGVLKAIADDVRSD